MILTNKSFELFCKWFENIETIKKYGQYNRIDLWKDVLEKNTLSKDFLFKKVKEQKFNYKKYRNEFCQKSDVEKYSIYIDFFDTLGILFSVNPIPYYGDTPLFIEDIPNRKIEKIFWIPQVIFTYDMELNILPEDEEDGKIYFDSREEATTDSIRIINNYLNSLDEHSKI